MLRYDYAIFVSSAISTDDVPSRAPSLEPSAHPTPTGGWVTIGDGKMVTLGEGVILTGDLAADFTPKWSLVANAERAPNGSSADSSYGTASESYLEVCIMFLRRGP